MTKDKIRGRQVNKKNMFLNQTNRQSVCWLFISGFKQKVGFYLIYAIRMEDHFNIPLGGLEISLKK